MKTRRASRTRWEGYWEHLEVPLETYGHTARILANLKATTPLAGKRVLEVGAGTGRDGAALVAEGARVVQVDYSMAALGAMRKVCEKTRPASIRPVVADAFRLPFLSESFDVVYHQGLLEHYGEREAAALLEENVRVLKGGGLLLVDVPQRYHPYTLVKRVSIALGTWFAGWEREFSPREIEGAVRTLGLMPVRTYGEWMSPSLGYRILRRLCSKAGMRLPPSPVLSPHLARLRGHVREALLRRRLFLYTAASIGVIARKPLESRSGSVGGASLREHPRP